MILHLGIRKSSEEWYTYTDTGFLISKGPSAAGGMSSSDGGVVVIELVGGICSEFQDRGLVLRLRESGGLGSLCSMFERRSEFAFARSMLRVFSMRNPRSGSIRLMITHFIRHRVCVILLRNVAKACSMLEPQSSGRYRTKYATATSASASVLCKTFQMSVFCPT